MLDAVSRAILENQELSSGRRGCGSCRTLRSDREILGQFGVPGSRLFSDGALGGHPLLAGPTTIIALVRLHAVPLGCSRTMRGES